MSTSPDLLLTCDGEALLRGAIVKVMADLADPAIEDDHIVPLQDIMARMHRVRAGSARAFFKVSKRKSRTAQPEMSESLREWRRAMARQHGGAL